MGGKSTGFWGPIFIRAGDRVARYVRSGSIHVGRPKGDNECDMQEKSGFLMNQSGTILSVMM